MDFNFWCARYICHCGLGLGDIGWLRSLRFPHFYRTQLINICARLHINQWFDWSDFEYRNVGFWVKQDEDSRYFSFLYLIRKFWPPFTKKKRSCFRGGLKAYFSTNILVQFLRGVSRFIDFVSKSCQPPRFWSFSCIQCLFVWRSCPVLPQYSLHPFWSSCCKFKFMD